MRKEPKNPIRTEQYRMERAAETDRSFNAITEAERKASEAKVIRLKALRLGREGMAAEAG